MSETRTAVADLLVHHQQTRDSGCHCGWADWGRSFTAHIATVLGEAGLLREDQESVPATPSCSCFRCGPTRVTGPFSWASFMPLCPTCGNKRCPRATNHVLACSGSNEPGQGPA